MSWEWRWTVLSKYRVTLLNSRSTEIRSRTKRDVSWSWRGVAQVLEYKTKWLNLGNRLSKKILAGTRSFTCKSLMKILRTMIKRLFQSRYNNIYSFPFSPNTFSIPSLFNIFNLKMFVTFSNNFIHFYLHHFSPACSSPCFHSEASGSML